MPRCRDDRSAGCPSGRRDVSLRIRRSRSYGRTRACRTPDHWHWSGFRARKRPWGVSKKNRSRRRRHGAWFLRLPSKLRRCRACHCSACDTESPTGCTKQLMSVACRSVPAAELTRPPGMKPAGERLEEGLLSWRCRVVFSTAGQRFAPRGAERLRGIVFVALGVFFKQHIDADLLLGEQQRLDCRVACSFLYQVEFVQA